MAGYPRSGSTSVLLVGLSFRSAPVPVLEKASVPATDVPHFLQNLTDGDVITESLVLSTCNRMEVYVVPKGFHCGLDHVVEALSAFTGLDSADLEPHLYIHYADSAAEHMLKVASGLDSMVLGEQQIIGQLRSAYQLASAAGTVGRTLHDLSQRALRTGKRVHSETSIDSVGASMVSFAVDQALLKLAGTPVTAEVLTGTPLAGKSALIIGAGAMASLASTHLGKLGVGHITVANRTLERAQTLASHAAEAGVSSAAIPLAEMPDSLGDVDIVVSATGATDIVMTAEHVSGALSGRAQGRPLALIDLSMPRDIDAAVSVIPGVVLLGIEQLTALAGERIADEASARGIVAQELSEFLETQRVQAVVPTVRALREKAIDAMAGELAQLERQTEGMAPEHREAVERSMRRLVEKLLHTPTVQAKKLSAAGQAVSYPDALAALFQLPTGVADAVSTPGLPAAATGGTLAPGVGPSFRVEPHTLDIRPVRRIPGERQDSA